MPAWNLTQFDPEIASTLGKVANGAYFTEDVQDQQLATTLGFSDPVRIAKGSNQALIMSSPDAILVAFRGTDPRLMRNWTEDLDAILVPGIAGKVHQGFQDALNLVWLDVLANILQRQSPKAVPVWFTGHSLGGAMATLAVANMRLGPAKRGVNGLYTFGCPRVGDLDFHQAFDQNFRGAAYRYVNRTDPVPRLPTRLMGYAHVGTFLHFDDAGDLQIDPGFWNGLLDSVRVDLTHPDALFVANIEFHLIANYLPLLDAFKNKCENNDADALALVRTIRSNPATMATL